MFNKDDIIRVRDQTITKLV